MNKLLKIVIASIVFLFALQSPIQAFGKLLRLEFPFKATLRGGQEVDIPTLDFVYRFSFFAICQVLRIHRVHFDIKNDSIDLIYNGQKLRFQNGLSNGDIYDIFFRNQYVQFDVSGRIVFDVGANIGDSAVYFAVRNAKKVIAIEPFPYLFSVLLKNIENNHLFGIIEPVNAFVSGSSKAINISEEIIANIGSKLLSSKSGRKLEQYSFNNVLLDEEQHYCIKMDCEGCEYEFFKEAPPELLNKFEEIIVEFHNQGFEQIVSKLPNFSIKVKGRESGILYAKHK